MKKVSLFMVVLILGTSFSACAAGRKSSRKNAESVQKVDPLQAKKDSMRNALELRKLELEMEAMEAEAEANSAIQKLKAQNALRATSSRVGQNLFTPCIEESYDKPGEYMAGLGIAENEVERGVAVANANRYAIADITTRYIGVIKNGVSQYAKNVNTRSGAKVKENELEGEAVAIGEKAIEKYAEAVCRNFEQATDGTYTAYVAVHVPIREIVSQVVDEVGVLQTDYDRQQFRGFMQAELDKQAAAKQAEQQQLQDLRQQIAQ